jgi:hypothetical protein
LCGPIVVAQPGTIGEDVKPKIQKKKPKTVKLSALGAYLGVLALFGITKT